MIRFIVWCFLLGIFLIACEGFNMLRLAIMQKLAYPDSQIWLQAIVGLFFMLGGLAFLGGLIFHRDQKRGRIKRPDWK